MAKLVCGAKFHGVNSFSSSKIIFLAAYLLLFIGPNVSAQRYHHHDMDFDDRVPADARMPETIRPRVSDVDYGRDPSHHKHTHPSKKHPTHRHMDEDAKFRYSKEANEHLVEQHESTGYYMDDKPTILSVWFQALFSTLLISMVPFFVLYFIPVDNTEQYKDTLKTLLAFAAGGLLGDAFLHLIPHAQEARENYLHTLEIAKGPKHHEVHSTECRHRHDHAHGHKEEEAHVHTHDMNVGLWVLAGIITFFIIEKLVRISEVGSHAKPLDSGAAGDEVSTASKGAESKADDPAEEDEDVAEEQPPPKEKSAGKGESGGAAGAGEESASAAGAGSLKSGGVTSGQGKGPCEGMFDPNCRSELSATCYLNLVADFAHNFTDGLAIGAAYLAGTGIGTITTFTVLLHEVPHEIGDYAILVQAGCDKKKAIHMQLITALGALLGTLIALLMDGKDAISMTIILPFTAGGFIYLALVSVFPNLLEGTTFRQTMNEFIALGVGLLLMILVADYE